MDAYGIIITVKTLPTIITATVTTITFALRKNNYFLSLILRWTHPYLDITSTMWVGSGY